ncbi:septum formation inhibitor Maf [Actinocrinis puniceicyclus]|uniref:Nucleoside triphosphate pyrophosphatase n=1 Tax=Actinocrinis puniceicyclus TaxID=977794 RepID=A0A8J8BA71_9ACTN|nr:nucleoside triphosphate pyrophosphatase [Actinocrinis puniceicyclus]MBS2961778.1 septum formation inhibitor Maf [Actinocrinis puniceicyclus]
MKLVLASQSPARLALLRNAGFAPEAIVSGVDEDAVDAQSPAMLALMLAQAKARTVARRVEPGALVVGCDSVLDLDGEPYGKPSDAQDAIGRWKAMRGREGILVTGHCLIDTRSGRGDDASAKDSDWREVTRAAATLVRFAHISDAEIDAYVATGEPLHVAGAFTLDGYGASFVESIGGDPSNVIGLSLPLLRVMLGELGIAVADLWKTHPKG